MDVGIIIATDCLLLTPGIDDVDIDYLHNYLRNSLTPTANATAN